MDISSLLFASAIFALVEGLHYGIQATNTMDFCTSCHSMQIDLEEYQKTSHFANVWGIRATCADCHVPQDHLSALAAKVASLGDVIAEWRGSIDDREKFEARRWALANRVWTRMQADDSAACRSCHNSLDAAIAEQVRSARRAHTKAQKTGRTCIDCHKGVVHREPQAPEARR